MLSNGKTIQSKEMCINSYSEGVCADMVSFSGLLPEEAQAELAGVETVPYDNDITFQCISDFDQNTKISPLFSVYDSYMNRISFNEEELTLPEDAGLYYVVLQVSWGTYLSYVGNQYIFKIER